MGRKNTFYIREQILIRNTFHIMFGVWNKGARAREIHWRVFQKRDSWTRQGKSQDEECRRVAWMLAGIKESGQVGWESGRFARVGRPPTILVPYAMACSLWKVPWEPVKP
jgi:hypothetical protein